MALDKEGYLWSNVRIEIFMLNNHSLNNNSAQGFFTRNGETRICPTGRVFEADQKVQQ
jgi:hypothetical protein